MTILDLKKLLDATLPGVVYSIECLQSKQVSKIVYFESATLEQKQQAQTICDNFNWDAPEPDIKGFFAELAEGIMDGAFPADVFVKAQMIERLTDPAKQALALNSMSADPSYTVEQKEAMNQLIAAHGLQLPEIQLAAMMQAQGQQ